MLYVMHTKLFLLLLCTMHLITAMERIESDQLFCPSNAGSDELLSTDSSEQYSHPSPREEIEIIFEQYMHDQITHATIISKILTSTDANKLDYLHMLAKTQAIFDNGSLVETFEQTNIFHAFKTGDLAIIDLVLARIQDFSLKIYDNILNEATKLPESILLLQKMIAIPEIDFEKKKDRCMISLAVLPNPSRDLIAFFLKHGANPTEGLSWYLFNMHSKHIDLFIAYGANVDKMYEEIIKRKQPELLEQLIALTSVKAPIRNDIWYEIFSYARQEKSLPLFFNLLKQLLAEKRCNDPHFDLKIPLGHLKMITEFSTGLVMHIAGLCCSRDFFEYCKNPPVYAQSVIDHAQSNYDALKKVCWWAALFNDEATIHLLANKLTHEGFSTLVNERGPYGFTAISYNALFNNSNLTLELMGWTAKKMDLVMASYFACMQNNQAGIALVMHAKSDDLDEH